MLVMLLITGRHISLTLPVGSHVVSVMRADTHLEDPLEWTRAMASTVSPLALSLPSAAKDFPSSSSSATRSRSGSAHSAQSIKIDQDQESSVQSGS